MDTSLERTVRRPLRISVRALMFLVLAMAVFLLKAVRDARLQHDAIAAIEAAGGQAVYDYQFAPLNPGQGKVYSWNQYVNRTLGPDFLGNIGYVELSVGSDNSNIGAAVSALSNLRQLSTLNLDGSGISYEVLKALPELRSVRAPMLQNCSVTDAGISHLGSLPNLECLWISRARISDDGLARLPQAAHLTRLVLHGTKVTDAGLESVGKMPALRTLELGGAFSDKGVANLRGLHDLTDLSLAYTEVMGPVLDPAALLIA